MNTIHTALKYLPYELPNGPVTIAHLPGVPGPSTATELLLNAARRVETDRVFVAGPGMTAAALWAVREDAHITYWTENRAEADSLLASFEINKHTRPTCISQKEDHASPSSAKTDLCFGQADFEGLKPESCGLALVCMPRGKALQQELLTIAAAMLKPGGRLAFVGAANEGIKSALKVARTLYGHAGIVLRKGGYHAGLAQRPQGSFPIPALRFEEYDITVNTIPTRLISCAGTFANDRLDDGARALIAGMHIPEGAALIDLGCGTGLVGLAAQRRGANVTFADVSARAVASTRRTLAANGHPQVTVYHSHGAMAVMGQPFDSVVTNPPFHKGHGVDFEVAQLFIQDAARLLKHGGCLYLVANAFLRYEHWLQRHFSQINIAWENKRFRVWRGIK